MEGNGLLNALQALSTLEAVAVLLAIAYLVLAARNNIWCWPCAFVSSSLYVYLFHGVALLSESALNVFYVVMAVYGWYQWRFGSERHDRLPISNWSRRRHLWIVGITALFVPPLGYYMSLQGASFPYLDALTSCFAVVTTYMVTVRVLENWLYWLAIDGLSIYLYAQKGLYLTVVLFLIYLVLAVLGYLHWRRLYRDQEIAGGTQASAAS